MAHASIATLTPTPEDSYRDVFSATRVAFFIALHLGVLAVFWQTTWGAIGIAALLHLICGGFGICVGYHRLLTHRSFKTPKFMEYAMATAGSLYPDTVFGTGRIAHVNPLSAETMTAPCPPQSLLGT